MNIKETYAIACRRAELAVAGFKSTLINLPARHGNFLLFVLGVALLSAGMVDFSHAQATSFTEADYNDDLVRNAVGNLFGLIEGAFGALVMVVAGLGAIVAAAMGAYRLAVSLIVVAVGAFILRALVSLFFGESFTDLNANGDSGS
ncbi:MAG: hypothetical protein PHC51_04585 [bacterium]|nr:hypothetical protein [bacterium]